MSFNELINVFFQFFLRKSNQHHDETLYIRITIEKSCNNINVFRSKHRIIKIFTIDFNVSVSKCKLGWVIGTQKIISDLFNVTPFITHHLYQSYSLFRYKNLDKQKNKKQKTKNKKMKPKTYRVHLKRGR